MSFCPGIAKGRFPNRKAASMKFGLFYLPTYMPGLRDAQTHYRGIIEQIEFADRIGIDYAWIVEHHFVRHGGLFPANYAFLSYLAGRTTRIARHWSDRGAAQ